MGKVIPYVVGMAAALGFTLVLTPLVRELNRRLGMVDKPDPRRINKVPIPRGGGLALFLGVHLALALLYALYGSDIAIFQSARLLPLVAIATLICLLGYADDKFNLPPKVKLAGQLVLAFLVWLWADLGFRNVFPFLPAWLDAFVTVFWIVGAVNAFNLIDGLDGLASGLALIATVGMGGSLVFLGEAQNIVFYCVFAGGLLGFLRYNYNPASVFLGDSGSMYIGYVIAVLPLVTHHASESFLVSVGVPLLAMGVPIFDTSLAIVRRSIRHLISRNADSGEGQVMTADSDHLHHRILRSAGLNQRKAAWTLYLLAIFMVALGMVGMSLESRTGGLWLLAVAIASVIIFKDIYRVELFDAGRLLNAVAHDRTVKARRRWAQLAVPFYILYDFVALSLLSLALCFIWDIPVDRRIVLSVIPVRVFAVFVCLAAFKVYRTIWSRAMLSNYLRLFFACILGSMIGGSILYYAIPAMRENMIALTVSYALWSGFLLFAVRSVRIIMRDIFYAIDCSRLVGRKDISRILVYGSGLRYRSFRRELVRNATANGRIIVGFIDDDLLLKGKYVGGIRVQGTLLEAPEIINRLNVDAVVIACEMEDSWLKVVKETLRPTGVKTTVFTFKEKEI
ncbi:MAG: hypothetical protein IKO64_01620 [Kiritimatiellae bacterium]|nr:hypothetical protein [Kiritimatiellia bacterium]